MLDISVLLNCSIVANDVRGKAAVQVVYLHVLHRQGTSINSENVIKLWLVLLYMYTDVRGIGTISLYAVSSSQLFFGTKRVKSRLNNACPLRIRTDRRWYPFLWAD